MIAPAKKPELSLPLKLVIALVLGTIAGVALGKSAEPLGELGLLVIKFLKTLAAPLVFFAVVDSFSHAKIGGKQGLKLIGITSVNALVAAVIALVLANLLPVGKFVDLAALRAMIPEAETSALAKAPVESISLLSTLKGVIPSNILEPFAAGNFLGIVFLAILCGVALRLLRERSEEEQESLLLIERGVKGGLRLLIVILGWVIEVIPFAVFGVIAKSVGVTGFQVFGVLGVFVGLVALGLVIHVFGWYSVLLAVFARVSPLKFFRQGSEALATAFTTGSSLATLPVTLRTLQDKMGVRHESARLAACVGTNLNNDGILLYEAVAALFIAQMMGIDLSLAEQAGIAFVSMLAAMGIAGVPEAGLITLSVVLSAAGLPLSAVPLLLPVDWLIGRMRATTNVASDMTVARLL